MLEDAGSSHGTLVDGRPVSGPTALRDGATISVGDVDLRLERHRDEAEAGRTIVVPANGSVVVDAAGHASVRQPGTQAGFRPAMRPGWRLKRLEADEGRLRWVLSSDHMPELLRMGEDEAAIVQMLDGETSLPELMAEAERRHGEGGRHAPRGPARDARRARAAGGRGRPGGARAGRPARPPHPPPRAQLRRRRALLRARSTARGGWVFFTRTGTPS